MVVGATHKALNCLWEQHNVCALEMSADHKVEHKGKTVGRTCCTVLSSKYTQQTRKLTLEFMELLTVSTIYNLGEL